MREDEFSKHIGDRYNILLRSAYLIMGNKVDAEDAVQDGLVRAWHFRNSLQDDAKVHAWLHRVVVTACYSKLRSEIPKQDRRAPAEALDHVPGDERLPEDVTLGTDATRSVIEALRSLPAALRVPVVLRYYAGLSEREIAIAVSCRQGTVKSRLHEARRRLAQQPQLQSLLGSEQDEPGEASQ